MKPSALRSGGEEMYKGDSPLTESRARCGRLEEGRGCRGETWWARRCEKGMGAELSFPPHLWYPGLDTGTGVIGEEGERRQAARRSPHPPASRRPGAERAPQTSPGNKRRPRHRGWKRKRAIHEKRTVNRVQHWQVRRGLGGVPWMRPQSSQSS